MNFLQLGQRLASECGAANVNIATMQNQTGEASRFVNWIRQAWTEIQTMHDDWEWMRSSNLLGAGVSFVPINGQAVIPLGVAAGQIGLAPSSFGGKWVKGSFRNYVTAVGTNSEIFMRDIGFEWWRDGYMYGANRQVRTRPVAIAVGSDKSLCIGPPSNGLYTVTGDYYGAPMQMSTDADVPVGLPDQYHMTIVYKGMLSYAHYEAAPEVESRGQTGYDENIFELERRYGPRVSMSGALA